MNKKKYYPLFGLMAFIILFQLFSSFSGKEFLLIQLTMCAYYSMVIIALCTLMGYAGQISLGHAAFFAIGGYTTAVLTTLNLIPDKDNFFISLFNSLGFLSLRVNPYGIEILHFSPWIALVVAVVITYVISFIIGIPILKLKGHYLAMATLGFGTIIYRVLLGGKIFGEADGISDIPEFNIFNLLKINGDNADRIENYYAAWFIVVISMLLLINLIHSRVGRALRSLHGNEHAANSIGVNPARYKLFVFTLSAVMAAVGGVFMTHFSGSIGPGEAGVLKSVRYVAIVAVGGMANIWGALIMGIILNYLSLRGYLGSYDEAIFGVILVLIMLFTPDGIFKAGNFGSIKNFIFSKIFKKA